jgi:molybdate transport system regulatory protein
MCFGNVKQRQAGTGLIADYFNQLIHQIAFKVAIMSSTFLKIRIPYGTESAMGPGKADLLDAIHRTGSISAAGRDMEMSYRRAWDLVDTMNRCFAQPLVTTATGGNHGGGAQVTEFGYEALRRYRELEAKANASVTVEIEGLAAMLRPLS